MTLSRRAALLGPLAWPLAARAQTAAPAPVPLRIGVLRFGTVSWELDVIRRHGLDAAHGIALHTTELAAAPATQVALQAGAVDVTAQDWLWVARQRADGADWTFLTFSTAIGALVAPADSPVRAVADLPGRRLGIAGSPLDKSWLILRAYAARRLGLDLDRAVGKTFGPPPLLAEQMRLGRLDAMLTFWPFAAKAVAGGARQVLGMAEAVRALGIDGEVPVAGYVFSARWAAAHPTAAAGLAAASAAARARLRIETAEWAAVRPLMGAGDDAEFAQLRDAYVAGIPQADQATHAAAAAKLFAVLAEIGGAALVGAATALPDGTFWGA